jgi:nucleoside-diphosphate-sugar epimerase
MLNVMLGSYSKWKAATENYLLQTMKQHVPNVTVVRPGGLYDDDATKTTFPRPNLHQGDTMGWGPTSRMMIAQLCVDMLGNPESYRVVFEVDDAKQLDDRADPKAILAPLAALPRIP